MLLMTALLQRRRNWQKMKKNKGEIVEGWRGEKVGPSWNILDMDMYGRPPTRCTVHNVVVSVVLHVFFDHCS
jgi:hypothetical protein